MPLIESTNTRYDQLAWKVNRIAEVVNIENPNDPIVKPMANAQAPLIGEENPLDFDLHVARRGQNANEFNKTT